MQATARVQANRCKSSAELTDLYPTANSVSIRPACLDSTPQELPVSMDAFREEATEVFLPK